MFAASNPIFSAYASFAASIMLVRSVTDQLIPHQLRTYISSTLRYLFTPLSLTPMTLVINEYTDGWNSRNEVFDAAELYLRAKTSPYTERLRVSKTSQQKSLRSAIDKGQEVADTFENMKLQWKFVSVERKTGRRYCDDKLHYELSFYKKHKDRVMQHYLPHVLAKAKAIEEEEKVLKIYTLDKDSESWEWTNLEHPSTFDTLAMEPEMKRTVIEDLDKFVRRREFYKKVGKTWKRGYLLYGPPGTGKSSLIAAMANYLNFSIYDLELSSISSNAELRKALLATENRSITIIEDIDCSAQSVQVQNREAEAEESAYEKSKHSKKKKVTLSGLLNFIDGLWSSCGDERIIVFTTNHKDRLDPALLRPGRMDVHINMSYCTAGGFNILASNYLGVHGSNEHPLCGKIEELIGSSEVTPAEVAEELMKVDDADVALEGLVSLLERKKVERNETKEDGPVGQTKLKLKKQRCRKVSQMLNKLLS